MNTLHLMQKGKEPEVGDSTLAMDQEILKALDELDPGGTGTKNGVEVHSRSSDDGRSLKRVLCSIEKNKSAAHPCKMPEPSKLTGQGTIPVLQTVQKTWKHSENGQTLAQKLLFSEDKEGLLSKHDAEKRRRDSNTADGTTTPDTRKSVPIEANRLGRNPSHLPRKKKQDADESMVNDRHSKNTGKDYILFSPTHVAAAKEKRGHHLHSHLLGNHSVSVLTPPSGLEQSSLGETMSDAGKLPH